MKNKLCKQCGANFEVTQKDGEYYEKISPVFGGKKQLIPHPTLCPDCRQQRRLSFRNERKLYKRRCDLSGQDIVSIYSPNKGYPVYDQKIWWSDKWNELHFGKTFDFSKSFFEQISSLLEKVPKQALIGANNENSSYCNLTADNKNCYLIFESSNNEDCLYGYWLQKCNNCVDCNFMHQCELCYESLDCFDCYNSKYLFSCTNCRDSYLLEDCIACNNCFGCVNLTNKEYYIFNKQYDKKEYFEKIKELGVDEKGKEEFLSFSKKFPKKYLRILNAVSCLGSQIEHSKNCISCFHAYDAEDCKYAEHVWRNAKNCMDVNTAGRDAEFIYESINCGISVYNFKFCVQCWTGENLMYCMFSSNIQNCFGCVGLRNKSYCILNKEYSKEEYEILVAKIIEHMKKTGEWGEFFPSVLSPFGYNETVANEYFELTKEEAGTKGFKWEDYDPPFPKVEKIIPANMLPEKIEDIPDDILNWAIKCEATNKPFRIIKEELEFYRKHNIPIPKKHPDERHKERMGLRNSRKLFERKCDKCEKSIKTTYSPERKEIVYCEDCYNKEVF